MSGDCSRYGKSMDDEGKGTQIVLKSSTFASRTQKKQEPDPAV